MEDLNSILLMDILLMIILFMKNLSGIFLKSQHHYHFIPHVRKIYLPIDEKKEKMPVKKKINIK